MPGGVDTDNHTIDIKTEWAPELSKITVMKEASITDNDFEYIWSKMPNYLKEIFIENAELDLQREEMEKKIKELKVNKKLSMKERLRLKLEAAKNL